MSVSCILWLCSLIVSILAGIGRAPLWVATILISIAGLLTCLPVH